MVRARALLAPAEPPGRGAAPAEASAGHHQKTTHAQMLVRMPEATCPR